MQVIVVVSFALLVSFGCALSEEPRAADTVVEAPGASGVGFGDPSRAVNGVRGGGAEAQSLDVYAVPPRAHLVLAWDGAAVLDGPGPDLVVFENPFDYGEGLRFMDPTVVEVSADGATFVAFPHDYLGEDERTYAPRPEAWRGFAGISPVFLHADAEPLDPFDPAAGGDAFDLADLPEEVRDAGVRFVRLSAASVWTNPDTGASFPRDPISDGVDIDGVVARHLVPDGL